MVDPVTDMMAYQLFASLSVPQEDKVIQIVANQDSGTQHYNDAFPALTVSLEKLLEASEDGLLAVGQDWMICGLNESCTNMLNLQPSVVGRSLQDVTSHLTGQAELLVAVQQVLAGQQATEHPSLEICGRHFMSSALPLHNQNREIKGALLSIRDVTQVQQLEHRFEFAMQAAFMDWWEWDVENDHVELHAGNHSLLGIGPESLPKNRADWMEWVHPDDQAYVAKNLDACLSGETDLWYCECRFRTIDGGWIWVDNRGKVTRRDQDGRPLKMMGTSQDIDASKRAHLDMRSKNDMLEKAAEIIKMGTWEYYPESNKITWSRETRRILGVDDRFEASADAFYECLQPDDAEKIRGAFLKTLEDGTEYNLRLHCINKQGKHLIVRSACKARYDLFGKLIRVTGIFQDITDEGRSLADDL